MVVIEGRFDLARQTENLPRVRLRAPQVDAVVGSGADAVPALPPAHAGGLELMASQAFSTTPSSSPTPSFSPIFTASHPIASAGICCLSRRVISLGPCWSAGCSTRAAGGPMIAFTYTMSGVLLAATGFLFMRDLICGGKRRRCAGWRSSFWFRCGELGLSHGQRNVFPLEIRALAIAFFYAVGTAVGGIVSPWLFGCPSIPDRAAACSAAISWGRG